MITVHDLAYLVHKMRQAQKEYFKTKDQKWLIESKGFEKRVDDEIKAIMAPTFK